MGGGATSFKNTSFGSLWHTKILKPSTKWGGGGVEEAQRRAYHSLI